MITLIEFLVLGIIGYGTLMIVLTLTGRNISNLLENDGGAVRGVLVVPGLMCLFVLAIAPADTIINPDVGIIFEVEKTTVQILDETFEYNDLDHITNGTTTTVEYMYVPETIITTKYITIINHDMWANLHLGMGFVLLFWMFYQVFLSMFMKKKKTPNF